MMKKKLITICLFIHVLVYGQENKFKINGQVPNFKAIDQYNRKINLNDLVKKNKVVLFFYRGEWCPYCNKQMKDLQDSIRFLQDKGAVVIAVTPESQVSTEKTIDKTGAKFSIINDYNYKIMELYGVDFQPDSVQLFKLKSKSVNLSERNNNPIVKLPVPASYIVTKKRKIKFIFFNNDYKKRVSIKTLLENL